MVLTATCGDEISANTAATHLLSRNFVLCQLHLGKVSLPDGLLECIVADASQACIRVLIIIVLARGACRVLSVGGG